MELKTKQDELKNVKEDLQYFQEEKEAAHKQSQVLRWEPKKLCFCQCLWHVDSWKDSSGRRNTVSEKCLEPSSGFAYPWYMRCCSVSRANQNMWLLIFLAAG